MLIVAASLIVINHTQTKKYLLEFAQREMALATQAVSNALASYLGPVATVTPILANAELGDVQDAESRERFFRVAEQVLDSSPQAFRVYSGFEDGSYIRVSRSNDSLRKLLRIPADIEPSLVGGVVSPRVPSKPRPATEWFYRERDTDAWTKTVVYGYEFDPRARPWYLLAEASDELQWTSVYVWIDGSAGITAAQAIGGPEYQFRGVVGIDVRLSDLATFLRSVTISENRRIFIARRNGRLVAHSQFIEDSNTEPQGERKPISLNVTDETFRARHPLDYRLFSSAEPNGKIVTFEHEGIES